MKRAIKSVFFLLAFFFCISPLNAKKKNFVKGNFEMAGFFNAGFGWQKFAGGTPTEFASDGSYAGALGSLLPAQIPSGCPVSPRRWRARSDRHQLYLNTL